MGGGTNLSYPGYQAADWRYQILLIVGTGEGYYSLRREYGNGAISRYVMLDESHARAILPVGFIPGHLNRVLDAIGWPVENAEDRFNRIVRAEALPLVEELLAASYIGFERASK